MIDTLDANDVLMGGGGAPTARFDSPGVTIGGRIVGKPKAYQEREYDPRNPGQGKPKVFPSGDPIMGITVDVQTALRDPSIEDDNGVRRIYVEGKRLKDAVRDAVRASNAPGLEVGGELHVTFTGLGQPSGPGINPPKEYTARYVPLAVAALNHADAPPLAAQQQPWPSANQGPAPDFATPAAAPAAAPAVPAPAAQDPVATARTLISLGQPDNVITKATGLTPEVVASLRNL